MVLELLDLTIDYFSDANKHRRKQVEVTPGELHHWPLTTTMIFRRGQWKPRTWKG